MEAPTSTASFNSSTSQEVLHPEEYDLAAVISQFSEFRDDSEPDINEEVLKKIDLDDNLFVSDHDEDIGDFSEESDLESDPEFKPEPKSESEYKYDIFFAVSSLTSYPESLSSKEV